MKKGMDKDAAYQATQRTATTAYNEKKNRLVAQSTKITAKTGRMHVIFLDKNHPNKQAVQNTVKDIKKSASSTSVSLKILFLIPELNKSKKLSDLPFSENFIA